jgi:HIV-1 Vpr-binding protein
MIPKTLQKALETLPEESNRITLESIMCDYLSNQHSLCKNPMVTCPEFDLFVPHKCPDPRYNLRFPFKDLINGKMMEY